MGFMNSWIVCGRDEELWLATSDPQATSWWYRTGPDLAVRMQVWTLRSPALKPASRLIASSQLTKWLAWNLPIPCRMLGWTLQGSPLGGNMAPACAMPLSSSSSPQLGFVEVLLPSTVEILLPSVPGDICPVPGLLEKGDPRSTSQ